MVFLRSRIASLALAGFFALLALAAIAAPVSFSVKIETPEPLASVLRDNLDIAGWAGREDISEEQLRQLVKTAPDQVRSLLASGDEQLVAAVAKHWGTIRTGRDPQREQKIAEWKTFVREHPGDPFAGEKVFAKVCGQCHTIYGKGEKVGPDITLNGRNSFDQLLSNVFDPSLVIGRAYQARTIVTTSVGSPSS